MFDSFACGRLNFLFGASSTVRTCLVKKVLKVRLPIVDIVKKPTVNNFTLPARVKFRPLPKVVQSQMATKPANSFAPFKKYMT